MSTALASLRFACRTRRAEYTPERRAYKMGGRGCSAHGSFAQLVVALASELSADRACVHQGTKPSRSRQRRCDDQHHDHGRAATKRPQQRGRSGNVLGLFALAGLLFPRDFNLAAQADEQRCVFMPTSKDNDVANRRAVSSNKCLSDSKYRSLWDQYRSRWTILLLCDQQKVNWNQLKDMRTSRKSAPGQAPPVACPASCASWT